MKVYQVTKQRLDYDDYPVGSPTIIGTYTTIEIAETHCQMTDYGFGDFLPTRGWSIHELEVLDR